MRSTFCLLSILAACQASAPPPPLNDTPPAAAPTVAALALVLPAPGGERATFRISRQGQQGYDTAPTRVSGAVDTIVALGEVLEVPIAASTTELTPVSVDGQTYLVDIQPGDVLRLSDNPCNNWALIADGWDANLLEPPSVACAAASQTCPTGFSASPLPGLAADPVCGDAERRCLKSSVFTAGQPLSLGGMARERGDRIEIGPTVCDFVEVRGEEASARLLPGVGRQWSLFEEDGRIVGRANPTSNLEHGHDDRCVTDADCVVTGLGSSCCPRCQLEPISKRALARRQNDCATVDVDCPGRQCPAVEAIDAACREGQCVVKQ